MRKLFLLFICIGLLFTITYAFDDSAYNYSDSSSNFRNSAANYRNSPANFQNSPQNFQNSSLNFQNSPQNYQNYPSKYNTSISNLSNLSNTSLNLRDSNVRYQNLAVPPRVDTVMYDKQGRFIGYETQEPGGEDSLFDKNGIRIGYVGGNGKLYDTSGKSLEDAASKEEMLLLKENEKPAD